MEGGDGDASTGGALGGCGNMGSMRRGGGGGSYTCSRARDLKRKAKKSTELPVDSMCTVATIHHATPVPPNGTVDCTVPRYINTTDPLQASGKRVEWATNAESADPCFVGFSARNNLPLRSRSSLSETSSGPLLHMLPSWLMQRVRRARSASCQSHLPRCANLRANLSEVRVRSSSLSDFLGSDDSDPYLPSQLRASCVGNVRLISPFSLQRPGVGAKAP